ncbi:MAG: 50S ribosomal protein L10 [Candidatus Omnitrophica bacterium]|jgi:large subunit ribosomal protein L10|nr:50S ribosomal protein L10 [Candidatus Omnitrophota bacterium]
MKHIGTIVREKIVDEIKESVQQSEGCFFVNFNKVKARSISQLRNNLRTTKAKVYVAKNSLFSKAFDTNRDNVANFINGETAVIFVYDKDIVRAAKALVDFAKENEIIRVKGGLLKDKAVSAQDLNSLAKLPPKEVLLGMAVSGLASPITGFVSTLNQVILKFVWVVEEIKKNKETNKK